MDKNIDRDVDGLASFAQQLNDISEIFESSAVSLFGVYYDCEAMMNDKSMRPALDGVLNSLTKIRTYAQFGQELSRRVINSCNLLQETDAIVMASVDD